MNECTIYAVIAAAVSYFGGLLSGIHLMDYRLQKEDEEYQADDDYVPDRLKENRED